MKVARVTNILIISGLLLAVLVIGFFIFGRNKSTEIPVAEKQNNEFLKPQINPETALTPAEEPKTEIIKTPELPTEFVLKDFPFQSQAPLGNWDEIRKEACEEASIILAKYYLTNKTISAEEMDREISKMVDWQIKNWGGHFDLSAAKTLELTQNYYGLSGKVKNIPNIDALKREIAVGNPVLVPAAGRLLGNPNFRQPGPVYHMVVAIGFDEKNIIVQDVGTRNGDHYKYNAQVFYNAIHDWAGSYEKMLEGEKVGLILTI